MTETTKFTGIVHYHGIGEQSRYESISSLVQSFEDYIHLQDGSIAIDVELEAAQDGKSISYIKVIHKGQEYRFYEVYWAPITAGGTSGLGVFFWMLKQLWTPLKILRSPWNARQRIRRGYLYALWEEEHPDALSDPKPAKPLMALLEHYNAYCSHDEGETHLDEIKSKGSFSEFLQFLSKKGADAAEIDLAKRWKDYVRAREFLNLGILMTMGYAIVVIPIILLTPIVGALWQKAQAGYIWPQDSQHIFLYVVLFLIMAFAYIVTYFLRYFGGDVQFWATYEETNEKYTKRKEILERGRSLLAHVLGHEDCERVIVMGHSLGTPISMDSLLAIGRTMRSRGIEEKLPVENIDAYITLASPIDKIHYFFESRRGTSRHYESIVDNVRGDVGSNPSPFILPDGTYNFKWYNFWDRNDYISGPVYTPFPRSYIIDPKNKDRYVPQIYNLLADNFAFPAPGRAHGGYFRNHDVFRILYAIIFSQNTSVANLHDFFKKQSDPHLYRRATSPIRAILPKFFRSEKNGLRDVTILGLWSLLLSEIFNWLGIPLLWQYFQVMFLLVIGSLIGLAIRSFQRGHLHSFRKVQARSGTPAQRATKI